MTNVKNSLSQKSPLGAFLCGVFFAIGVGIVSSFPLVNLAEKEIAAQFAQDKYSSPLEVVFKFYGIWGIIILAAFITGVLLYVFAFKPKQHANQNQFR